MRGKLQVLQLKSSAARGALCEGFGGKVNQGLLWLVALGGGIPLTPHRKLGQTCSEHLCKLSISTVQAKRTKLCSGVQVGKKQVVLSRSFPPQTSFSTTSFPLL